MRLRFEHGALAIELSAGRDGLVRKNAPQLHTPRSRSTTTCFSRATGPPADTTLEAYAIVRDDHDADRRPVFAGLRAWGEPIEDLDYWLEIGYAGAGMGRSESTGGASTSAPPTNSRPGRSLR